MDQSKVCVRYAKALFLAALESDKLDEVRNDIDIIMNVYSHSLFKEMLESPVVKISTKRKVVDEILNGRISSLSFNFLNLLLDNKRDGFIVRIVRDFLELYKESKGIKSAELTVSRKVDEKSRSELREILQKTYNCEIELNERIKPEILGGFILKVENEQYDASVASGLTRIRKKLLETSSVNK